MFFSFLRGARLPRPWSPESKSFESSTADDLELHNGLAEPVPDQHKFSVPDGDDAT